MNREEEISLIAYRIWQEENHYHGRDFEHWLKAEVIWEQNHKKLDSPKDDITEANLSTRQRKKSKSAGHRK
jgi:hypothetical protein